MSADNPVIQDDMVVSVEYTLHLDDGEQIDSSAGRGPLEFLQGRGQIISGLEQAMAGMAVGDSKDVVVEPAAAYGEFNPDANQVVPQNAFPQDMDLQEGMGMQVQDEHGHVMEAFVAELRDDDVVLDFNHPLAGETLHCHVDVVNLRPATSEELAHGHVHGEHGHHH